MRDDDDPSENDDPLDDDMDPPEAEDDATIACPYCGKEIYEGTEQCPKCRRYISEEDAPRRVSRWLIVGAILAAMCVVGWILRNR